MYSPWRDVAVEAGDQSKAQWTDTRYIPEIPREERERERRRKAEDRELHLDSTRSMLFESIWLSILTT